MNCTLSRVPFPLRLGGYAVGAGALVYVNSRFPGVLLFWISLTLAFLGAIAAIVFEGQDLLRRENSLARVLREVVLVLFFIGLVSALLPYARFSRDVAERQHLGEFEKRLTPDRQLATYTVDESGFAGKNFFELIVFDKTGQIAWPPERRSDEWWAVAKQADRLLTDCRGTGVGTPIKPHFYRLLVNC